MNMNVYAGKNVLYAGRAGRGVGTFGQERGVPRCCDIVYEAIVQLLFQLRPGALALAS